jgi:hypothetical protein
VRERRQPRGQCVQLLNFFWKKFSGKNFDSPLLEIPFAIRFLHGNILTQTSGRSVAW